MIDRNHPAVKAMIGHRLHISDASDVAVDRLNDALQLIGPDDLRDTPAGRALLAEGWDALIENMSASGEFHDVDLRTMERLNPYKETPNE